MKPYLSWPDQIALMAGRGLLVTDESDCARFLASNNYYRFSGYARYFQRAPHLGDDDFLPGTAFDDIRCVYDADASLRDSLVRPLAHVELLLRSHVAHVIGREHGAYGTHLEQGFYKDVGGREPTVESCLRDIDRSKDRHILRYRGEARDSSDYGGLPVWSAVEAWSFGTLSKVVERGAQGALADSVATSIGVAKAGFAYRVRAFVYLRNRCAHHNRLWNHSIVDAGPTPNNVRTKAKRLAGQFGPRSVLDVIASLDDITTRGTDGSASLPELIGQHDRDGAFWKGLATPQGPKDHLAETT
ncbi:Abi family protein [Clavibacter capsici]|uniref:Abi family protein n=1 Tax=Clavibacter capsici TaxID=1874630 RepID=A0AAE7CCH9_9MICO|nr:Abi family protein [Clavibacter capsici]ALD13266.1 abortive phage resistance protein [Clavibacter capsici]QIS45449.1 Abi family protein [Clavibacter capsici]